MFLSYFADKHPIEEFSHELSYKVYREQLLGEGAQSKVYRFRIECYEENKSPVILYLAGKELSEGEFYQHEGRYSYLKHHRLITYHLLKFNLEQTKIDYYVKDLQEEEQYLEYIIFLTDFSLNEWEVEPINIEFGVNLKCFEKFNINEKKDLFTKIFDDILDLARMKLWAQHDLWMIIYKKTNAGYDVRAEITDVELIDDRKSVRQRPENVLSFFQEFIEEDKVIMREILQNKKYKKISELYHFDQL